MKKLFTFLTLVLFAMTVQAADEVIFSATVISTDDVNFDPGTTEIASNYATVVGGKVYAVNNQTSAKKLIAAKSGAKYFCMTNNNTYFKITLDKALAVGDVITAKALAGKKTSDNIDYAKGIYVSTSEVTTGNFDSAPACAGTSLNNGSDALIDKLLNYTVTEGSEYVGATTLYVYRAAGATEYWGDFVITRAETPTPPPTPVGTVTDVLTSVGLGATATGGNSYADFTGKTFTSNAVYAANISAGNVEAIQLRSKNSNSGIVSTTSGGKLKKVVLNWASNTSAGRKVQIYGSNTAYAAPTDLYGTNQGTLLAELNINDATEYVSTLEVTDDYEYVGIRSQADALFLASVEIEWEGEAAPEQPKLYVIGDGATNGWDRTAMDEMAYNADTQTYTYQYVATSPVSNFAIADYQQNGEEASSDPSWAEFNTHRYYIANIDGTPTLDTEFELTKGDGIITLGAGVYTISIKDMKITISGELAPEGTIFYAPMATGLDGFTTEAPNVWSYNSQYSCAYGTAYNKEVVGPFDLVSPVIDLTNKQNVVLTFSHAGKFFTNVAEEAQLLVKLEADGAEWTPVAIPNHVTNENFNWVESGEIDLSAYNNEKIRIAFRYSNTEANKGGTWEIKNVVVAEKAATPTVEHLYLLGGNAEWTYKDNVEVPFDEEAQAFKYEIETENDHFFSFADKNDCASWDELNGDHRWAYVPRTSGDFAPELNVEYTLIKVEGTFKLPAGKYTVTVTKDMKMTVTGEVTPTLPAYIDYPTTAAGITIGGTTEMDAVVKIHNNADEVKGIKFANGYTTEEGALNANYATIEIDGGFKAGDVISIAGAFNNSDETKKAAVDIFTIDEMANLTVLFTTQQFVNGRVSANDPAVEKFTLEADYDKLYLGRKGNTATFVTLLKTERSVAPTVEHLYLLGGNQDWHWANNAELPFDETTQAWTYEVDSPAGEHYFAFADKNDCASWDELNGSHRWALEAGDIVPEINAEYALTKVNGTVKLPAGQYTVTVTKDMKMTVKAITDGIRSIENSELRMKNSDYYNLASQRVGKDYKGIVIVNGKKVLVK